MLFLEQQAYSQAYIYLYHTTVEEKATILAASWSNTGQLRKKVVVVSKVAGLRQDKKAV